MNRSVAERPLISAVIPCYNEEENVVAIHAAVAEELARCTDSYEIIFIDNCSTDRTRDLLRAVCAQDPRTRAIFNNRNYGQMRSPTYAIYQAEGQAVIAMCADFQDPPKMIGALVDEWRRGAEIVLGVRRTEKTSAWLGLLRRSGYRFLEKNADSPIVPGATGFGLFDRKVVDVLAAWHEPEPFFRGMLLESGFKVALLPYDRPERAAGVTKNGIGALLDFAVSGLAGSSKRLLRRPILWGFVAGLLSVVLLAAAITRLLIGHSDGLLLILAVQFGLFAVLFLFLGLIGEQVRMISERTRQVPLVIERERVNFPADRQRPATRSHVVPPAPPAS